ncbi:Hypothetical protein FKW44_003099 [Caligus rogercresseyi]|uniref:Uncharacterized protein n=1 Tax=Caligus rogercresseyi TaxID=217165 RepID=A0A7T8QWT1_CALRO|nr:Hypothetical protein FKW44_003099 [Caligus rogercresseyi]
MGPQFPRKQSGCLGLQISANGPSGRRREHNGLFWSYKSLANGPSGSAKRNRAVSHKKCLITYRQ